MSFNLKLTYSFSYAFISFILLNRHADQIENPLYTAVDQPKSDLGPRVSLQGSKTNSPVKGPLDPTVPYAVPQKKNKSKKPRRESHEKAMGKSFVKKAVVQQKFRNV